MVQGKVVETETMLERKCEYHAYIIIAQYVCNGTVWYSVCRYMSDKCESFFIIDYI